MPTDATMQELRALKVDATEGLNETVRKAFEIGRRDENEVETENRRALREIAQLVGWTINGRLDANGADQLVKAVHLRMAGVSPSRSDWIAKTSQELRDLAQFMGLPDSIWLGEGGVSRVVLAAETAVRTGRMLQAEVEALRPQAGSLRKQADAAVNRNRMLEEENERLKRALQGERGKGYRAALREMGKAVRKAEGSTVDGPRALLDPCLGGC